MTIIATTRPTFPGCPTYGFTSRPEYLVKVIQREGGYERRDRKWSEPLHFYDGAPMGDRPQADIEAIAAFYHAMGGTWGQFRFKDWADYKSCALDFDPTPLDQPFVLINGSPGGYQLSKTYNATGLQTVRYIRAPVGSTIVVANTLGATQAPSSYTIEEDTGLLTPGIGFTGTPGSWGGQFYVPCRFAAAIAVEITNFKIMNLACSIKEIRPEP